MGNIRIDICTGYADSDPVEKHKFVQSDDESVEDLVGRVVDQLFSDLEQLEEGNYEERTDIP